MAVDCLHEPPSLAFAKAFGSSFVVLAAVAAWLLNNAAQWFVWRFAEARREFELLKGLNAEIRSFSGADAEGYWADRAHAAPLIASLKSRVGATEPLVPYLVIYEETVVFDGIKTAVTSLPAELIEAVVVYYYQTLALNKQLLDFRSDVFARLSRERQAAVIRGAFDLGEAANVARERAQKLIALKLGAAEHRRRILGVIGILALLAAVPATYAGGRAIVTKAIRPAVEWASTCDLAPKSADIRSLDMGTPPPRVNILPQKP